MKFLIRLWWLCLINIIYFNGYIALTNSSLLNGICLLEIDEKCGNYTKLIMNLLPEYEKLSNSVSLPCHLSLNSAVGKLKESIERKINLMSADYLRKIDEMKIKLLELQNQKPSQPNNDNDIVSVIRNGNISFALKEYEKGKLSLNTIVSAVYSRNLIYGETLLKFLDVLPNIKETLLGYRLLLEEMISSQDLYSTLTTTMAYRIANLYNSTVYDDNRFKLLQLLPLSLKTIQWNSIVLIKNIKKNEGFIVPRNGWMYDSYRRMTFTYIEPCESVDCQWKFMPTLNGTSFQLKNYGRAEYLIADLNEFAWDAERRRVFTRTIVKPPLGMDQWTLEPIENSEYFKIKNTYWNEYLYIEDDYKHERNINYRNVFTWRAGDCEFDGCQWKITPES